MEFCPKLTWDNSFSPLRNPEFVRKQVGIGVTTRQEYEERNGKLYHGRTCAMGSGISPQVNWDGKMLGCCVNYWGDFGGNVFRDGLLATINGDKMRYARDMLLGHRPPATISPARPAELSKHKSARFLAAARRSIRASTGSRPASAGFAGSSPSDEGSAQ